MKNMIFGYVSAMIAITFLILISIIMGRTTRKKELTTSLSILVDQSVENVMSQNNYSIHIEDKEEFVADVVQTLVTTIENDSDIQIDIVDADNSTGLLCLKVTEFYKDINDKQKKIEVEKTVILEKDEIQSDRTVIFKWNDESLKDVDYIYKKFTISDGEIITAPKVPVANKNWKANVNVYDKTIFNEGDIIQVTQDIIFEIE